MDSVYQNRLPAKLETVEIEKCGSHDSNASPHSGEAGQIKDVAERHRFKTMSWLQAGLVMIAETVSLGILSLPAGMAHLGFVPGTILIVLIGLIAWYTGFVVYQFKLRHPSVRSYPEIGQIVAGRAGRWIAEVMSVLQLVFIAAAHVLTFSVMMNVLTDHGTCTIVFGVVGAVVSFILTLPRSLRGQAMLSAMSCGSICTAVIIAMVAVGIAKPGMNNIFAIAHSSFAAGASSVSSMIIAFTGHVAYPNIIDEMKEERDFPKALALLACCTITFYLTVAVVIYFFGGANVPSPAFGAASPLIRKICYGVAIPTIFVAGTIAASICAKRIYNLYWRWCQSPAVVYEKTRRAWLSWIVILVGLWFVAWLIASLIPIFHELLSLIGAAFATQFCLAFNAVIWLSMQWQSAKEMAYVQRLRFNFKRSYCVNWRKTCLSSLNVLILVVSLSISGVGVYASITAIAHNGPSGQPFSCANNAH